MAITGRHQRTPARSHWSSWADPRRCAEPRDGARAPCRLGSGGGGTETFGGAVLSPYRVLDLTDDRGHLAGFLLGQLGADVIVVEPPEGSSVRRIGPFVGDEPGLERSLWHLAYNRGKRSVTFDSVDFDALCRSADVLIECGAVPIDLDRLLTDNPGLVAVSISPFGRSGPKAAWAATDLTVAAASGQLVLTGDDDRPPVRISEPQVFHHAAADAAVAAVVGLVERAGSGRGQHVDVSAQQSFMVATQGTMLAAPVGSPEAQRLAGGLRAGPYPLRLVYPAMDGQVSITYLFGDTIGPYTQRLMSWAHEEGCCSDELADIDYVPFFELLYTEQLELRLLTEAFDAVARLTATKTKAELLAEAQRRKLLIAPVATTEELASFDQFAERGFWDDVDVDLGDGPRAGRRTIRFPGRWAHPTRTPLRQLGPPPRLGSTTRSHRAWRIGGQRCRRRCNRHLPAARWSTSRCSTSRGWSPVPSRRGCSPITAQPWCASRARSGWTRSAAAAHS